MKRGIMSVEEYESDRGIYTIVFNNVRFDSRYHKIIEGILRVFVGEGESFLGFYRTDGVNMTPKQWNESQKNIRSYFNLYENLKDQNNYLAVAKLNLNGDAYRILPLVFDYYLETILFKPQLDWKVFKQFHCEYMLHSSKEYITRGYTNFLFTYFDSGDCSICFNSQKYKPKVVKDMISKFRR